MNKAKQKFKNLYMRLPENFHNFYIKFLHLAAEVQISPKDLLYELNEKLSFELRDKVMTKFLETPTLTEFSRYCNNTDNQIKALNSRKDRIRNKNQTRSLTNNPTPPTTSTWNQKPDIAIPKLKGAENLALLQRPQYSDPEKQSLSRLGACFVYKKTGHLAKFCPQNN
jgi:hypothetical protein